MDLVPKLTPYWYTLENDPEAQFRLSPLTQPQLAEVEGTFVNGMATTTTFCKAAIMTIVAVKGITDPETGQPAKWPMCQTRIPVDVLTEVGAESYMQARGRPLNGLDTEELESDGTEKNSSSQSQ